MQNPTVRTPLTRCFHLGHYTSQGLKEILKTSTDPSDPNLPILTASAVKMADITSSLKAQQAGYDASKYLIVEARVALRLRDYFTDIELANMLRRVQIAENQSAGPVFKQLAPAGKAALTRPFGQSQLDVLVDLETKLTAIAATWKPAAAELAVVTKLTQDYRAALQTRDEAWKSARNLRLGRDLAKAAFLKGYTEVSLALKALYVDNKRLLEMLFDDVEADVEKDLGSEEQEQPATPVTPAPAPAGGTSATPVTPVTPVTPATPVTPTPAAPVSPATPGGAEPTPGGGAPGNPTG